MPKKEETKPRKPRKTPVIKSATKSEEEKVKTAPVEKVIQKKKEIRLEKENKRFNLYSNLLLLIVVLLISNLLIDSEIVVGSYSIIASVFVYPFVYLFSMLITRENGKEKALLAVLLAAMIQAIVYLGINAVSTTEIEAVVISGSIIGFLVSQVLMILLYDYLIRKFNKVNKAALFIIFVFVLLVDNLIFTYVVNLGILRDFGMTYVISSAVRTLMAVIILYAQHKIEQLRAV